MSDRLKIPLRFGRLVERSASCIVCERVETMLVGEDDPRTFDDPMICNWCLITSRRVPSYPWSGLSWSDSKTLHRLDTMIRQLEAVR